MKMVAIIGMPGTGKTTLMKRVMEQLSIQPTFDAPADFPLVVRHTDSTRTKFVIGKYEDGQTFAGTDRLSMAVQPQAIKWVDVLAEHMPNAVVIWEGDRLSTPSFLRHCAQNPKIDLTIWYLTAPAGTLNERYAERGSNQDAKWLAGRQSKYDRLYGDFTLMDHIVDIPHCTPEDTEVLTQEILDFIQKD